MVVAKVKSKVEIRNIPDDVVTGKRSGFVVARVDRATLWYYGCYETELRAATVATELGNGVVLEVGDGQKADS